MVTVCVYGVGGLGGGRREECHEPSETLGSVYVGVSESTETFRLVCVGVIETIDLVYVRETNLLRLCV